MNSSAYYGGAVGGFKMALKKAERAGVHFTHNRLPQFEQMLLDFITLELEVISLKEAMSDAADGVGIDFHAYAEHAAEVLNRE